MFTFMRYMNIGCVWKQNRGLYLCPLMFELLPSHNTYTDICARQTLPALKCTFLCCVYLFPHNPKVNPNLMKPNVKTSHHTRLMLQLIDFHFFLRSCSQERIYLSTPMCTATGTSACLFLQKTGHQLSQCNQFV